MANLSIQIINGRIRGSLGIYASGLSTKSFNGSVIDCAIELKQNSAGEPDYVRVRIKDRELALSNVLTVNTIAVDAVNGTTPTSIQHLYNLLDTAICQAINIASPVLIEM